jgi:thioredoxin 1
MMKKIVFLLFIGLLVVALQGACGNDESQKDSKTAKQEEKKAGSIKVTFIELGSVRCIPCKKMQPIMEEIKKEYKGQVKVVFYDVWTPEGRPYAYKYKIRLIPTQVFLDKDGKEYFRHLGFFPKEELVKVLKQKGVK